MLKGKARVEVQLWHGVFENSREEGRRGKQPRRRTPRRRCQQAIAVCCLQWPPPSLLGHFVFLFCCVALLVGDHSDWRCISSTPERSLHLWRREYLPVANPVPINKASGLFTSGLSLERPADCKTSNTRIDFSGHTVLHR